jgi:hypothetical protein
MQQMKIRLIERVRQFRIEQFLATRSPNFLPSIGLGMNGLNAVPVFGFVVRLIYGYN